MRDWSSVRQWLFWLLIFALSGLVLAQAPDAVAAPSAADCRAAAASGRPLPAGCADEGGSLGPAPQSAASPVALPQLSAAPAGIPAGEPPRNPSEDHRAQKPPHPQTEFEQLVADTAGRALPLYGQSLFAQPPSTFAPTVHAQVPDNYLIGPNDELQIHIWGQLNADLRVVVDRSGRVYIPHVGPVSVVGVRYHDLGPRLKDAVGKFYRNFHLSVAISRIRSIQVYVVGQARYPGVYTISALSTLVNAVFASGGPTPDGSLRDIQVQRDGVTIAHMDLYDLLVRGDKSKDIPLETGDVLYYPPVGPLAAITGSVNAPAIYELRPGTTLEELIATAGGLSSVADASKVTVERIAHGSGRAASDRTVLEFPLDKQSRALALRDGDIVRVFSIVPRFANAVTLRGQVTNPGRYPWKPGMRIRDLIPNAQALLTRPYWLGRDGMTDDRSTEYPIRSGNESVKQAAEAMRRSGAGGSQAGSLRAPGRPNQSNLTADLHLASPEINWSYAIVQRVNPVDLSTRLIPFNLGKAVLDGDEADNIPLQPNDIVTIFSQSDVAVPENLRTRYVRLEGEVRSPGVYKLEPNELLPHLIRRAGGLTREAYLYGTVLTRESARRAQQKSLDQLTRTMEVEMNQAMATTVAVSSPQDAPAVAAQRAAQEALIAELRSTRASGRVVLNLRPYDRTIAALPPIRLEDNDRIVIPHVPSTISVIGMVYNPGSFVFNPRRRVGDYLKMAGKGKPGADMRHAFVMQADGTVVARGSVNGLFAGDRFDQMRLSPGDEIVVPNKIATGKFVRGLRNWTQISSQLALTSAALAVIH